MHTKTVHLHNDVQGDGSNSSRRSTFIFPIDDGELIIFFCCWTIQFDHDNSDGERTLLKVLNSCSKHLLLEKRFHMSGSMLEVPHIRWK